MGVVILVYTAPAMLDPDLFTSLFAEHSGPVLLYARQLNVTDPEELLQETFLRLFAQPSLPPEPRPWLITTLRRLAIDRRRSWFRRVRRETAVDYLPWFQEDPGTAMDARLAVELLHRLPQRQREVITLRIWNDLSLIQIARILQISDSTVHTDLKTALSTLRQLMETPCPTTTTKSK